MPRLRHCKEHCRISDFVSAETENKRALRPEKSGGTRWWVVGKYGISLVLIAYLVTSVEWLKVWASVSTVSLPWLLIGLFYIPAGTVLVASRYHRLIDGLISYRAMLRLVIFQGAISTFLANAAGSLTYIGILTKVNQVPAELAVQSTIIARLGDLFSSLIVAAVLVALAWNRLERIQSLLLLSILLSTVLILLAILVIVIARRMGMVTPKGKPGARVSGATLWQQVLGFGVRVIHLKEGYVATILPATLWYSFLLQAVIAIAMYCNVRAFHLDIGFFEAALVGVVASFIASVPITVFGGLGVYEVSTVGLLAVFGVPIEGATGMILVVRTMFFLVMATAFVFIRPTSQ